MGRGDLSLAGASWLAVGVLVVGAVASVSGQTAPQLLRDGQRLTREVRGSEVHEYRANLRAGQSLHLVVNQVNADVVVVANAPGGVTVIQVDSPNGANGPESLWMIAQSDGPAGISVKPFEGTAQGRYELAVSIRTATRDDRRRVEMQTAVLAARKSSAERSPEGRVAAVRQLLQATTLARTLKDRQALIAARDQLMQLDGEASLGDLGVPKIPGTTPVYFSRGQQRRATEIRDKLSRARAFFEAKLQVSPPIQLAVLSERDWSQLSQIPYGVPWSSASVVSFPASLVVFDGFTGRMSKRDALSPDARRALSTTGLSLEAGMRLAAEDLMFHELGHIYTEVFGIRSPTAWFNELLANFFMEAYLAEMFPNAPSRRFAVARREWFFTLKPRYTTLPEFERVYLSAGIDNYGWFQSHFEREARRLVEEHGFDFLRKVKQVFPAGGPRLPPEEITRRLDTLSPSLRQWAGTLSGNP